MSDDVPPDLIVSAVSAPAVGGAGAPITVNETTKNQGGGPSDVSTTAFYLSVNTVFDATDIPLGTRAVGALAAGGVNSAMTPLTIPPNMAAGTYYVIAKADAVSAIVETLENNNTRASGPLRVGPDLTVTSLSVPSVAGDGDTISVSDTTSNAGGGDAGPSRTALFLSTNPGFDALDQLIGGRDIGPLGAGAFSSATTQAVIPPGTAGGLYYVLARADQNNSVVETLESNNVRASAAIKIGPDLVVSNHERAGERGRRRNRDGHRHDQEPGRRKSHCSVDDRVLSVHEHRVRRGRQVDRQPNGRLRSDRVRRTWCPRPLQIPPTR